MYSADTVGDLSSLIHDAYFDLADVKHDPQSHTLTIPYRTTFHDGEDRLLHRGWFTKKYEKDWLRRTLLVHNVTSFQALKDQGIGTYSFYACKWDGETLDFQCNESLTLRCVVTLVHIEDDHLGFKGRARFSVGPLNIWTSSGRVFE